MLIDWNDVKKHFTNIKGIIHVGANTGEEAVHYGDIPTIWIEADPTLFENLKPKQPNWTKLHFAGMDYDGEVSFNLMPFRAANSIFKPNAEYTKRPDIYIEKTITVPCKQIKHIQTPKYNMLNLDVQGAELHVLRGADLSMVDYVYCEVNDVDYYFGIPKEPEITEFLNQNGFSLATKKMYPNGFGDAVYVKDRKSL